MKVPFLDLKTQYEAIRDEINVAIQKVLESCAFASGPFVEHFEKAFASFCQCKYCVAVGSGTEALWLSLLALDIGPGDEVITVPNTFIATAEAISFTGAKPVFVDIDEQSFNMDPNLLEKAITRRTKAVIPVHLYGQMADMDPITEISKKQGLHVIEDACQAHGAEYKGRRAGSIGNTGCFSFYPGKNLGAYGEAGAIVTNNEDLAKTLRILRDHGQPKKYYHTMIGWNCRMDGLQGAIMSVKLKHLEIWNQSRIRNARLYDQLLLNCDGVIIPKTKEYARHVYHVYAIRTKKRDELISSLAESGISCGIHYPLPIHLQEAYSFMGLGIGSFPFAESYASELLSLPMFPELSREQIGHVVTELRSHLLTSHV